MRRKPGKSRFIGERVFLRTPAIDDWPEFSRLTRQSARSFNGLAVPIRTKDGFTTYVHRCLTDDYLGLLICRIEDEAIVGSINLSQIVRNNFQSACVGYWIGLPHLRQGYMTEALRLVLAISFRDLKLHRIEANIQPGNGPSIALVKRAGFVKEGFSRAFLKVAGKWRDHERWAMLAEQWRLRPIK